MDVYHPRASAFGGGSLCCPPMKAARIACTVLGALALAGCELLYDPDNLPSPIDAPDGHILNLDDPRITGVGPLVLLEGQGTGGSKPAILTLTGSDMARDATVALTPVNAQGSAPMIEIDNAHAVRSIGGEVLAVPVTLPIDKTRGTTAPGEDVALTVQITQTGSNGSPVMSSPFEGKLTLRNLPELEIPISDSRTLAPRYSAVTVGMTTDSKITAITNPSPAVIRAVGSIVLGNVHADASGKTPGPGGGVGGDAGKAGGGMGGGAAGSTLVAGGGGAISSDELITAFATSGGGGGGGGTNPGGGGGGTLEITAGGTLTVGAITANGANGQSGVSGGGGGSGGAIILRSGALAMFGAVTTTGGAGGVSTGSLLPNGGPGGGGRLRYDVPPPFTAPAMLPAHRRGVAFDPSTAINPLVTNNQHQVLRVWGAAASTEFTVFILGPDGNTTASTTVTLGSASADITPTLSIGYNRVCVTPPLGNPTIEESSNCIDIAYVP